MLYKRKLNELKNQLEEFNLFLTCFVLNRTVSSSRVRIQVFNSAPQGPLSDAFGEKDTSDKASLSLTRGTKSREWLSFISSYIKLTCLLKVVIVHY